MCINLHVLYFYMGVYMAILNKEDVLKQVVSAARKYKSNLLGRNFLIVSKKRNEEFKYWELKFEKRQFKHLVGLETSLSSNHFYEKSTKGKLSIRDFELKKDGTTQLKLEVLPLLMEFKDNVRVIGYFEDCSPRLMTEVLAGNNQGALGFVSDDKEYLVPNTCLKCDTKHRTDSERIVMILSKKFADKEYVTVDYKAIKNFNVDDIVHIENEFTNKIITAVDRFKENQETFSQKILPKEIEENQIVTNK